MARTGQGSRIGIGCLTLFLLVFVVGFGGFGAYGTYQEFRVRSFLPVKGTITHSSVGESRGDDGTTYYPDIRFRYSVNGEVHTSGEYRIMQVSSGGRSGKQQIVDQYPVGSVADAWYDPSDASVAVLDRSFGWFPLIFLAVGLVVLVILMVIWVKHLTGSRSDSSPSYASDLGSRTHELRSGSDSIGFDSMDDRIRQYELPRFRKPGEVSSVWGLLFFAVAWNGITWTVSYFALLAADADPGWFLKIFLSIFILVGVFLVLMTIHMALSRMKLEAPRLSVSIHPLLIGESAELHFSQAAKKPIHVNQVKVSLICRESATYRRGTDTTTVTEDVHKRDFEVAHDTQADSTRPIETIVEFEIPQDAMHSFAAHRNRVDWLIEVKTDVANWPDYSEKFELTVAPKRSLETR